MKHVLFRYTVALFLFAVPAWQGVVAQVRLSGMVTDSDTRAGLPSVSIWNKRARIGTLSSETGRYFMQAMPGDTVEFSMLGYVREQVVVPALPSPTLNIELHKQIIGLSGVRIKGRIYQRDSLAIREEYAKYFGYKRPGAVDVLKTLPSNPITALSYLIPNKARRRKEKFGEQLKYWEEEKNIDYRFNPELVQRITRLESPQLDSFMLSHRPSYHFLLNATEYDLMLFIKQSYQRYAREKGFAPKDSTTGQP